jgi:3-dehydroquinate dehydratase/shikimate dehydrogenase
MGLHLAGASVTIPHKERLLRHAASSGWSIEPLARTVGAANTLVRSAESMHTANTDAPGLVSALVSVLGTPARRRIVVAGAGGAAAAAAAGLVQLGADVTIVNRTAERAEALARRFGCTSAAPEQTPRADVYINCTPVGMTNGPDPEGLSIPVHDLAGLLPPETVFFDTVYNPIETPMLRAARSYGFRTIDGVEMFVRQASAQFELWTGRAVPVALFDRLVRAGLGGA